MQSVSYNIPTLYLIKITNKIEKILTDFLWEGVDEGKEDHLVNREMIFLHKSKGAVQSEVLWQQILLFLLHGYGDFPLHVTLCHSIIKSNYEFKLICGWGWGGLFG